MQSINQSGMPVIVLTQSGQQNEESIYRSIKPRLAKQLIGLGVVHTLIGVCCIILQYISFWNENDDSISGVILFLADLENGICSGIMFLVTGFIGIIAGIHKKRCQVIAFLVLSIVSATFASFLLISAVVYANTTNQRRIECEENWYKYCKDTTYVQLTTIIAMESLLAIMGIFEGVVAIWSSVICRCISGVCSCCHASPSQTQQPIVGSYPNQETAQYYPPLPKVPSGSQQSYAQDLMSAEDADRSYTSLNIGMKRNLPTSDAAPCATTSTYEELHVYVQPLKL